MLGVFLVLRAVGNDGNNNGVFYVDELTFGKASGDLRMGAGC